MTIVGPLIDVQGLEFSYGPGQHRLSGIDLQLPAGGRLAVVGANGSGKTTLLRLLSGRLRPAAGRIRVAGQCPHQAPLRGWARRVGVVGVQDLLGFPYTVEEVVLMGRAPHVEGFRLESTHDLEVAHGAMRAMHVLELAGRIFDTLSSGEKQRVAVARALAQEPELLLLDEPGAFLDIKHQVLLYDLLAVRSRERGVTVVSVLHDLNLAALYFETVMLLSAGRVLACGPPQQVFSEENLCRAFDTQVQVRRDSSDGRLTILPLPITHPATARTD